MFLPFRTNRSRTLNEGGCAEYSSADRKNYYHTLNMLQDRIYLASEHLSYLTRMADAFESARNYKRR